MQATYTRKPTTLEWLTQRLYVRLVYPLIAAYLKKDRRYTYKGFRLIVFHGIFHPAFFFSSKYFFSFIDRLRVRDKRCLEVGCGSGLLSLLMLRKGGWVTTLDIQERAVSNAVLNYQNNRSQFRHTLTALQSDLFAQLPPQAFDLIVVNPPYYFVDAQKESEQAWFCGKNGEYFQRFFAGLGLYCEENTDVYMILAENCEISRINRIASEHGFGLVAIHEKKMYWEKNFIFRVSRTNAAS